MANPFDQDDGNKTSGIDVEGKTAEELMAELVGEGKKYASAEEAVKALAHAQNHIGTLESDNEQLRSKVEKASTVDDIMNRLKAKGGDEGNTDGDDKGGEDNHDKPASKDVDIEAEVKRLLGEHTQTQSAQKNYDTVIQTLQSKFGSKAFDKWDEAEKQLGVDLEGLAKSSPDAVFKLMGISGEQESGDTGGSFNGDRNSQDHSEARPPEGSKRLVDYLLKKGDITRQQAYKLKLEYSSDPEKYKS